MDYFDTIKDILYKYQRFGIRTAENGTILIGHAPHVAPEAWLHKIFLPLTDNDIMLMEDEVKLPIPIPFKQFLKKSNGLQIFITKFSLYGLRRSYERIGDNTWQPFAMDTPNTIERIRNAPLDAVFIGSYSFDGSRLYMDRQNKVYRCLRWDATPINRWNSFEEMLLSEVTRITKLFDSEGRQINKEQPTTPPMDASN